MDSSYLSDSNDDSTEYDTDKEIEPLATPPKFEISGSKQSTLKISNTSQSSILPLCFVTNACSLYNKKQNFKKWLMEISPDIALVSETWERPTYSLSKLIPVKPYKILSYNRDTRSGGGCAIFSNENKTLTKLNAWKKNRKKIFFSYMTLSKTS